MSSLLSTSAPLMPGVCQHKSSAVRADRLARLVWCLSGLNLVLVVAVLLLIFVVSERWWVAAALTYLPRFPWILPALLLGVLGWCFHRPSLWINALSLGLVVGPIMELRVPLLFQPHRSHSGGDKSFTLRVVSCNVQAYNPNFAEVMREVTAHRPDLVLLQEAFGEHPLLSQVFPGWYRLHHNTYWFASRYPLRLLAECPSEVFQRISGVIVELDTPSGPIVVVNVHQMTARRGLIEITKSSVLKGEAGRLVDEFRQLREIEAEEIRAVVEAYRGRSPVILAGDFNTPTSSHVFQQTWGGFQSAFDVAGWGYGYTSPCRPIGIWPADMPWARIDHILCSPEFTVKRCQVGRGNGSDHRLIVAELLR